MKFTDGYWMVREGVRPIHPREIYEIETGKTEVVAYGPSKGVMDRGDTLNGALFTTTFSSPMEGVVRVRHVHHAGAQKRGPAFAIATDETFLPTVKRNASGAVLQSGDLEVHVDAGTPWSVRFIGDGRALTSSGDKSVGHVTTDAGGCYMHEQLLLEVGTTVYGLGERFGPLVKNGQVVDIWNEDGGTSSEQAYKNVPFFLTNRGYGVFVNDPGNVSFEVASEKVARVQWSVPGEILEYFVIYGPEPKDVLRRYTALTGRPALPPRWSFGLWLTTSFTTSYDETTVSQFVDGMRERRIPLHVFHFDTFWMHEFNWCDLTWDESVFPDPPAMLQRMAARGVRISLWINPYIAQRSKLFREAVDGGYLLKRPNGDVWQIDMWQPGMGVVDFTNPAAREWFRERLRPLIAMGVHSFKTDFGERIPTDVAYFDGSDPERMHNYYSHLYNETVFDLLREERGDHEAVLFARSATAGGQQFPVHWGGDCESTFVSMAESLRGGLSLGMSGFGFWSHDIGGFEGTPPPEVYKRWIAFGLLSSHSRLHGSTSYRVPWLVDEESVEVLRVFTNLKCALMPYLYRVAVEAHTDGIPMVRGMILEFPSDPAVDYLDRQYMLGDALLVAPIFSRDDRAGFYLPAGRWTHFLTNEVVEGPAWRTERHGFLSLPLYVRPDSVIPVGADETSVEYDFADGVCLRIYELRDGARHDVRVHGEGGSVVAQFAVERTGSRVLVRRTVGSARWSVLAVGRRATCRTATVTATDAGAHIAVDGTAKTVELEIQDSPETPDT